MCRELHKSIYAAMIFKISFRYIAAKKINSREVEETYRAYGIGQNKAAKKLEQGSKKI